MLSKKPMSHHFETEGVRMRGCTPCCEVPVLERLDVGQQDEPTGDLATVWRRS